MTSNDTENMAAKDIPVPDMSRPKYGCFISCAKFCFSLVKDKLTRIDAFEKDGSKL